MSYAADDAVLQRIREVLEQSAGTLRTVPLFRFVGNLPPGLSDKSEEKRALLNARVFAQIVTRQQAASSPPILGNQIHYRIGVEVRVVRLIPRAAQLDEPTHYAAVSQASIDADVIRQALCFPGNLLQTSLGAPTGLASGMLSYVSTSGKFLGDVAPGAQRYESVHQFTGIQIVVPNVAAVLPTISIALATSDTVPAVGELIISTVTGDPAPRLDLYRDGVLATTGISAQYQVVSADLTHLLTVHAVNSAGTAISNGIQA